MERNLRLSSGGATPKVGLDIGSSAVRAVELGGSAERPVLRRFGQVGLEAGAVVEGEIRDEQQVAAALRRLWADAGFESRKVVVGVGGQRVIVREASVTAMSAEDFRSAIEFEAQDLIPIPTAEAVMDFEILGEAPPAADGRPQMRILLAAANRDTVERLLKAVEAAGLYPVAVDVAQAAILRGARLRAEAGPFGVAAIGADLTNVVIGGPGLGTFSRTLAVGAGRVTAGLGIRLGVERPYSEAIKRYAGGGEPGAARAAGLVAQEAEPIVEQIRESLDYFLSHTEVDALDYLCVTGGGALTPGLVDQLQSAVGTAVYVLDPFEGLDLGGVEPSVAAAARPFALEAAGLAAWQWEAPAQRLSLIPAEVVAARQRKQFVARTAVAGGVLVLALGGAWFVKHHEVTTTRAQVASLQAQSNALNQARQALSKVSAYYTAVDGRQKALSAVADGISWPAVIEQISAAMPPDTTLSQVSVSSAAATSQSSTPTAPAAAAATTLTMSVKASGGVEAVAGWLRAMATVPSLSNAFVASSSTSNGVTTFTCTATVTSKAPHATYGWEKMK